MKINAKNGKYLIVIAFAIAAIISIILFSKVKINYNISDYLDEESETKISLGIIEEQFGLSGSVQVMVEDVDVARAAEIKEIIANIENVVSVKFDENSSDYYKDGDALFTVLLNGDEYSSTATGAVADIENALSEEYGERLHLGGTVSEKIALKNAIQKEIALILAISLCLVAVLMLITAKSWLEPFVILASAGVAVLLNMGTNIFFGQISYITNAVAAILQLALSMDYSIMLLHGYRDMKKDGLENHAAMIKAIKRVVSPVSASALTTMAGLLALLFMSFRIGFDIGIVLMKSIFISAVSALTLLPAFLLIFDTLLAKTEKRELVLKGDAFCKLALKCGKFISPAALLIVATCCVFQGFNSYSFTDASNKNQVITDAFGENNTVIIVYENDEAAEEKERELASILSTFKRADGAPVLKSVTSLATTVREQYDVKAASDTLGVSEENAELLFALYHLRTAPDSVKLSAPEFISFANTLLENDPAASSLASAEIKKALGALASGNMFKDGRHTAAEFSSIIAESGLIGEEKLNTLKAMIKQMYGLYFYNEIEDNTVVVNDMLAFIAEAANNPLAKGFISEDTVAAVKGFIETISGLGKQRSELVGYITLKQELTAKKQEILTQKNDLIALKQELSAEKQELMENPGSTSPLLIAAKLLMINDGLAQIDDGIAQIDAGVIQINDGLAKIEANLPEIESGIEQIDAAIAAVNEAHSYDTFIEAIKTFTAPESEKLAEKKDALTEKKNELTNAIDDLNRRLDDAAASGDKAKQSALKKEIATVTSELKTTEKELAETIASYNALEGLNNISSEAVQQLYILYFDANGKIPNKKILKSDFIDFVISTSETNSVIKSFVSDETLAMITLLSDSKKLSYSEMTETFNALASAMSSLGSSGGIGKVSDDLLMGTYVKYASQNDVFAEEKICAEDLVTFLSEGELPFIELSDEQKDALGEAKAALESGKDLLVGENYSRILLTVDLPAEGADSSKFATDITTVTKQIFGNGAHVAGEIISSNDLATAFDRDNRLISVFTIVSIFIIIMLIFRSISLPVLLVAIIQGAIWIAMSTSLITGPMFFMSYIMAICILMGATIDYGILMSTSYVDARASLDKKNALLRAVEIALPTVFTSGLILMICGLVVGLIASQTSISSVGFLLFKGTLISTIMITTVLPAVLYLLDGFILKFTLKKKKNK